MGLFSFFFFLKIKNMHLYYIKSIIINKDIFKTFSEMII